MPMLRRRKKPGPRDERRERTAVAPEPVAARSRRRMKPGAVVPPELRLPESKIQEVKRPVEPKAPGKPAPAPRPAHEAKQAPAPRPAHEAKSPQKPAAPASFEAPR